MSDGRMFVETKLPSVLTKEEMLYYFNNYKNGDLEAREKIICHNIRLVIYIAQKYDRSLYEKEELVGVGIIGLIKAVDTYDLSKNSFFTYVSTCINNEILMYIRRNKKHLQNFSLDKELESDADSFTLKDVLPLDGSAEASFEEFIGHEEEKNAIRSVIDSLSGRDWDIFKLYYGFYDGKKHIQAEIAKMYGLSQSLVARVIKKRLVEITEILVEKEVIEKGYTSKPHCKSLKQNTPNV